MGRLLFLIQILILSLIGKNPISDIICENGSKHSLAVDSDLQGIITSHEMKKENEGNQSIDLTSADFCSEKLNKHALTSFFTTNQSIQIFKIPACVPRRKT